MSYMLDHTAAELEEELAKHKVLDEQWNKLTLSSKVVALQILGDDTNQVVPEPALITQALEAAQALFFPPKKVDELPQDLVDIHRPEPKPMSSEQTEYFRPTAYPMEAGPKGKKAKKGG